jgi:hypothetical protein
VISDDSGRPKNGAVVIWDVDSEATTARYWVRTQARGSATQLFEGPDAWARAFASAEERAGSDGIIWKRHKDGHFERLPRSSAPPAIDAAPDVC